MSDEIVYTSRIAIERTTGSTRRATLPQCAEPVWFGVHSEIAQHYGVDPDLVPPHAATLDYVVAATGGWLIGTLGGALEARGIDASEGKLRAEVTGDIGKDEKVLVIRRIHVQYRLEADPAQRTTIERVHAMHVQYCPVARSIRGCIEIDTALELV